MKSKIDTDVTINVTAHKEGYYLHKTLKSVIACCEYAKKNGGITSTIQINLDNPDVLTAEMAKRARTDYADIEVYSNSFNDPSLSRNFLVSKSTSPYLLFWDGDDLFTENFILQAYQTAVHYGRPCVVSAKNIIKFNDQINPQFHVIESTVDKPYIKSALFETNLYISQNFVSAEIYKKCKYESNNANYGFEDWHWNTKVINEGYEFLVAPNTFFFYRQKPDNKSLLKQHTTSNTVLRQADLFMPEIFQKLPHNRFDRPVYAAEIVKTYENPLKGYGRTVIKKFPGNGRLFYPLAGWVYHMAQTVLAPMVHNVRKNVKPQRREANKSKFEDKFVIGASKKYNVSSQIKVLWCNVNKIEPLLYFSKSLISEIHEYKYAFEHSLASAYYHFCSLHADKKFTDIIFVPWVNKGGADLAMLDLAKVLTKNGKSVLLITTSGQESQWYAEAASIERLVIVQSHDEIFNSLDHINIKLLFLRIIQNWNIETVTVMNSSIGFELIDRYGKAIKDVGCRTIVHNYAFPQDDGQIIEAFSSFPGSLEFVDIIITDSNVHKHLLQKIYGVPDATVIKVPLTMTKKVTEKIDTIAHKVLFANRFAREKQPQIAIQALRLLQDRNISMDMFGTRDDAFCESVNIEGLLMETANVKYKESFEGSESLDFNAYDICFMPSIYEGIPRICLDAIKANLFIVCTNVGGLTEIVKDGVNGIVLDANSTPDDFADALIRYYETPSLQLLEKRKQHNAKIIIKHSVKNYEEIISKIYQLTKG